jgi:hypothetical protein
MTFLDVLRTTPRRVDDSMVSTAGGSEFYRRLIRVYRDEVTTTKARVDEIAARST